MTQKYHAYTYSATPEWQATLIEMAEESSLSRSEYIRQAVDARIMQQLFAQLTVTVVPTADGKREAVEELLALDKADQDKEA